MNRNPVLASMAMLATLLVGAASANLLTNPGFTTWQDPGHPTGWTVEDTLVTRTRVERDSTTVKSSPYSARLTRLVSGTGSNYGLKQFVPVAVGHVYTIEAWCYDDNVDASGGISVTWCRADTTSLGNTGTAYSDSSIHTWQQLTRTDTVPDSCVYAKVLLRIYGYTGNQPNGFAFFDDVVFDTGYGAVEEARSAATPAGGALDVLPNPVRTTSAVLLNLARATRVDLALYDLGGKRRAELFSGRLAAGSHRFGFIGRDWRGARLPAGLYFLVMAGNGDSPAVRKVVLEP